MKTRSSVHQDISPRDHRASTQGFSILEIMIVVAIIGMLAVLAIPSFIQSRRSSQNASFMNSLRLLNQEMQLYAMEEGKGDYPPDAPASTIPPGFEGRPIRGFSWTDTTPIGGHWDWDRAANRSEKIHGCYAGVSIVDLERTSAEMADLDERLDDGDLTKGRFRQHAAGYIYVMED